MKLTGARSLCFIVALLLAPLGALVAEQVPLPPEIARIAGRAGQIDEHLSAAEVQTKIFTRGAQSGVLSYYTNGDAASKLVVQLVSDQSGDVTEYYYENGQVIYVVEACSNFGASTQEGSLRACRSISEDRYYLSDGKLVGWLSGKGDGTLTLAPVPRGDGAFARKGKEVKQAAALWRAFALSPASDVLDFESGVPRSTLPLP